MDWDLKLGRVMDEGTASVERVARRRRTTTEGGGVQVQGQPVTCLVDGCTWDLSSCREYHRRHRVCERHSKTPVVLVAGQEQRFCQQCSRFHSLGEFDEAKRSCRKRLDGHNRRRRKSNPPESSYLRTDSSSPAATTTPPPRSTTTLFPPPPLFHHLRRPPLPPSMFPPPATIPWRVAAPSHPLPQQPTSSPSFGYVNRHHDHESTDNRHRGDGGHIDCALSLLSSGTHGQGGVRQQHLDWQQQQLGFYGGGGSSASASHGGSDCYGFDDDDESDGAPCRIFPFWD